MRKPSFRNLAILLFSTLALGLSTYSSALKSTIVHANTADAKEELTFSILKLALEKSGHGHEYQFEEYPEYLTEARLTTLVREGSLSLFWAGSQPAYEEEFYPIRIPIMKGLLGHRIFIIRQGTQALFDRVQTLDDLREIPLGQGRFWGDTVVLKHANLNVVDPPKYITLFNMLEGGRFDYFPRAVHEPWAEVSARPELNLAVEKRILLVYPFSMYFFVPRDNMKLGKRIERGFHMAIDDGSFDELFFNHPLVKDALDRSNLKERIVFRLSNPNLPPNTPVDNPKLWLNIEDL